MTPAPPTFEEFVLGHSATLHRTAALLLRDQHAAKDLVQDALLQAWRHWGRVQRAESPEAYVRTILTREFLTSRRRRWTGEHPTDRVPEPPAPHRSDPEDRLALADAVAALPAQQRTVVVLRYFHDLTEAQTAETMGISVGTVKSHHARALAALRISDQLDDGPDRAIAVDGKAL